MSPCIYNVINSLGVEEKALIGNIAPKLVTPSVESGSTADAQLDGAMSPAASTAAVASSGDSAPTTGGVTASSWNHAGTWEERDTTTTAKVITVLMIANGDYNLNLDYFIDNWKPSCLYLLACCHQIYYIPVLTEI